MFKHQNLLPRCYATFLKKKNTTNSFTFKDFWKIHLAIFKYKIYLFFSHFKKRLWIILVEWMKANYCMWCCWLNSEGAWWGMLHQGSRMLSQPKRKHIHTHGPDNCQWNKLISAPLLKKNELKQLTRVWGYEGKSPSTQ